MVVRARQGRTFPRSLQGRLLTCALSSGIPSGTPATPATATVFCDRGPTRRWLKLSGLSVCARSLFSPGAHTPWQDALAQLRHRCLVRPHNSACLSATFLNKPTHSQAQSSPFPVPSKPSIPCAHVPTVATFWLLAAAWSRGGGSQITCQGGHVMVFLDNTSERSQKFALEADISGWVEQAPCLKCGLKISSP